MCYYLNDLIVETQERLQSYADKDQYPELSNDEKLKVLEELGFAKDKNIYQANNKTIKGNVQYSFRYDANYGFIFSVIAI